MKLVKEYINEKFIEDSDPIQDMGIGTRKLIEEWLKKYDIYDYKINDDLTIDVFQNVKLSHANIHEFPPYINFNKIKGIFTIQHNMFTSLRGCPKIVEGMFSCSNNKLTSLKYCPKKCHSFYCHDNKKQFDRFMVLKYCNVIKGRIETRY